MEENKDENSVKNNNNTSLEANKTASNINKLTYVTKTFYSPKNYQ
jgi:hypothetical protein